MKTKLCRILILLALWHGEVSGQLSDDFRFKLQAALEVKPALWGVIETESPVVWSIDAPDTSVDAAYEALKSEPLSVVLAGLEFLLTPQEGRYAPLRLIERLISLHNPAGVDWPQDKLVLLNEAFLRYTAFHGRPLALQPDAELHVYLALLTEHLHDHQIIGFQTERSPRLVAQLAKNDSPTGFVISRHALLQPTAKAGDALVGPSDYVGAGDGIYLVMTQTSESSEKGDLEQFTNIGALDLESGKFDLLDWKPASPASSMFGGIQAFDSHLVLDNGSMSVLDLDTRSAWAASIPGTGLYGQLARAGNRMILARAAPPHYFGALERDKELAQNADYLARLKSALYVWDLHSGKKLPAVTEASVPFLGVSDFEFTSVFGLESRRLVSAVSQRWTRDVPMQQLYVTKPDSLKDFDLLATMPADWAALPWQGHPDEVLLLSERLTSNSLSGVDAPQPERVFALNVRSRQLRLLWGTDARQTLLRKWRVKPYPEPDQPHWKLPAGISPPPPGEKVAWEHLVTHNGDIIALCARTRVGRQLTPDYELLVFREKLPSALHIPIQFAQNGKLHSFLQHLRSEGMVNPVRFDHLDARPIVTSHHLAFSSWYGVWWVSWDEVDVLIRNAMHTSKQ